MMASSPERLDDQPQVFLRKGRVVLDTAGQYKAL